MDIKEIALRIAEETDVKYPWNMNQGPWIVSFSESLISAYKAELLKEVGEPVLYAEFAEDGGWLGDASEYADYLEEPHALFTSDQVAVAVLMATKPLDDQLAAAQEEIERWKNGGYTNLWKQRTEDRDETIERQRLTLLELRDQLAKAEQRVAEACSAYMLNKNYNSLEFDRKYSAKEFCAGQKSTVEFLSKMIRSGEWRKFMKEV